MPSNVPAPGHHIAIGIDAPLAEVWPSVQSHFVGESGCLQRSNQHTLALKTLAYSCEKCERLGITVTRKENNTRLDARAHPEIPGPGKTLGELERPFWPLRKNLKVMLRRGRDDGIDILDERHRDIMVKEVAHRIHENQTRFLLSERHVQGVRIQIDPPREQCPSISRSTSSSRVLARGPRVHALQSQSEPSGVAIGATGRYSGAPSNRVPRRLCPLDSTAYCPSLARVNEPLGPWSGNCSW